MSIRYFIPLLLLLVLTVACNQQPAPTTIQEDTLPSTEDRSSEAFDASLAEELRADDYGMSQYVMAFLKKGPNRQQDSLEALKLQQAHLENIGRLANEGKLLLAGPMMDDGDIRGIYIFDVTTIEEAKKLTETDPAIQQGRLVMELHPWYGSAAVRKINEIHNQIAKINI